MISFTLLAEIHSRSGLVNGKRGFYFITRSNKASDRCTMVGGLIKHLTRCQRRIEYVQYNTILKVIAGYCDKVG